MKITSQEEFGLRILIRIAGCKTPEGMSIPQLSKAEGLTPHYVAKLTRTLRLAGLVNSTPGNKGGYVLSRPDHQIRIREVLKVLGGVMFDEDFCGIHAGNLNLCTNSVDCSVRSLWRMIQFTVDQLLDRITLQDMAHPEQESTKLLREILLERSAVLLTH